MSDTQQYLKFLERAHPLRESVLREVIRALSLPYCSRGLDAGCGIGQPALMLAEAVGTAGHVTGIDNVPEFIAHANHLAERAGMTARTSFQVSDVAKLPFDAGTFDWVWSADCVGYMPVEPEPLIKGLARMVKPGGMVVLLAWSLQQLLPGYPILEATLNATSAGFAPFRKGMAPERHFMRALGWFENAGLKDSQVRTFIGEARAPISVEIRDAITDLFEMRWGGAKDEVSDEDWEEFRRLSRPDSPDFILNLPEYYAFFSYTVFSGSVTGGTL